jgi:hypothetical protein
MKCNRNGATDGDGRHDARRRNGLTQRATAAQGARAAVRECANARGVVDADDCARGARDDGDGGETRVRRDARDERTRER